MTAFFPLAKSLPRPGIATVLIWAGAAALALPTLYDVATGPWAQEDGIYGVIVLAIAIWLVMRGWPTMVAAGMPGSAGLGWAWFGFALVTHLMSRVFMDASLETGTLYLVGIAALYLRFGWSGMRVIAFPLFYLARAIPLPPPLIAMATSALRLMLTDGAVRVLHDAGYMIASEGFDIYIDQQIAAYRAANPYVFAKRQILTVDQTQVMPRGPLPKGGRDTSFALMEQLAMLQLPTKESRAQLDKRQPPRRRSRSAAPASRSAGATE